MSELALTPAQIKHLETRLQSAHGSIKTISSNKVDPKRLTKVVMMAAMRNQILLRCDPKTVVRSVLIAAQLSLELEPTLGEAYLVPYYSNQKQTYECQLIVGYRGYVKLARRSGAIDRVEARIVHERDDFHVEYGFEPSLIHRPFFDGDPGGVKCAYAICWFTGGGNQFDVMTIDELDRIMHRTKSRDKNGTIVGPWITDFEEMAKKTVLRRAAKLWPLGEMDVAGAQIVDAITVDSQAEAALPQGTEETIDVEDMAEDAPNTTVSRIKERLRKNAETQEGEFEENVH